MKEIIIILSFLTFCFLAFLFFIKRAKTISVKDQKRLDSIVINTTIEIHKKKILDLLELMDKELDTDKINEYKALINKKFIAIENLQNKNNVKSNQMG